MATGIVAVGCRMEGLKRLAFLFLGIAVLSFLVLAAMTLLRVALFPRDFYADLTDHNRGVGFLTLVAAVAVLGSALDIELGWYGLSLTFWIASLVLWTCFTYAIFAAFIIKQHKPSLGEGIHGGWLLAVVATEAVAQLTLLVEPRLSGHQSTMLFVALVFWLCGGMLYIWMISLIFYRYTFFVLSASHVNSSYWIDMGGMAIATLVGTMLLQKRNDTSIADLDPFIKGLTIMFWATATWWIPMLVILSAWRHVAKPFPKVFDASSWTAVFPVGMYAVATQSMATMMGLGFLSAIAGYLVDLAVVVWCFAALRMVRAYFRRGYA